MLVKNGSNPRRTVTETQRMFSENPVPASKKKYLIFGMCGEKRLKIKMPIRGYL